MTANRWLIGGAALLIAFGVLPASAQNANDLQTRINRLERDIRDLQAATFRRPPGSLPDADLPADAGAAQPAPDLGPMLRRMDELEETLGRLTGQMEELGHQVEQLTQKS